MGIEDCATPNVYYFLYGRVLVNVEHSRWLLSEVKGTGHFNRIFSDGTSIRVPLEVWGEIDLCPNKRSTTMILWGDNYYMHY